MAPSLQQVNLVVGDLPATLAFYRLLGVDLPEEAAVHAEARFGDFSMDSTTPSPPSGGTRPDASRLQRGRVAANCPTC